MVGDMIYLIFRNYSGQPCSEGAVSVPAMLHLTPHQPKQRVRSESAAGIE